MPSWRAMALCGVPLPTATRISRSRGDSFGLSRIAADQHKAEFNLIEPEAFPYATVVHALRDFNRTVRGEKARIVPWLQDFTIKRAYGLEQVGEQIDAARAMHAGGFLLWNAKGVYTSGALQHTSP